MHNIFITHTRTNYTLNITLHAVQLTIHINCLYTTYIYVQCHSSLTLVNANKKYWQAQISKGSVSWLNLEFHQSKSTQD